MGLGLVVKDDHSISKGTFSGSEPLDIDIPTNIKELKVQESKEQASPKSETQSIVSADTSNRDMEDNNATNNKKISDNDDSAHPEQIEDSSHMKDTAHQNEMEEKIPPTAIETD